MAEQRTERHLYAAGIYHGIKTEKGKTMFNKKKIAELTARIALLENKNKELTARAEVLAFKEEAKGAKYIVAKRGKNFGFIAFDNTYNISYLSENGDKVITKEYCFDNDITVHVNDKYVELWRDGKISCALFVCGEKLLEIDIDIYKKAFADRINGITNDFITIKASAEKALAPIENLTAAVKKGTKTAK